MISFLYQNSGGYNDMKDNSKVSLQLRLPDEIHKKVKKISDKERRSLNAQIEYFIIKEIENYEREHGIIEISPDE